MKAVLIPQVGAAPEIGNVDVPEPGEGEILVKAVYTAVNPVYVPFPTLSYLPFPVFNQKKTKTTNPTGTHSWQQPVSS